MPQFFTVLFNYNRNSKQPVMWIVVECTFHDYDPASQNYGEARNTVKGMTPWRGYSGSMHMFCTDMISQAIQTMNNKISPEPSMCCFGFHDLESKLFSFQHEDKFYYTSPPFFGPCNRGVNMMEFVDLYREANPDAKDVEFKVKVLKRTTMAVSVVFNFHEYDHVSGDYEPKSDQFKFLQICDNDQRTMDEFCKDALRENVQKGSESFGIHKDDALHYESPPVFSPANRGTSMVDLMNLYRSVDPDANSMEIAVNVFRRNETCSQSTSDRLKSLRICDDDPRTMDESRKDTLKENVQKSSESSIDKDDEFKHIPFCPLS